MGKLVLVDTPGADEEALYSELEPIVEEQLKGSSAVLLVIDFTQRDNRAAARVRDQVREVVDVLGNDHLLVVVNKIDERRSKDDPTWEDFVRSIGRGFDIESSTFRNQMFEVSARRAFRATECLHTLRTNPSSLPVSGLEGVSLLLEEMHPFEWQKILTTITAEEVETKCQLLWENSGFPVFLSHAVSRLIQQVGPRCMAAALKPGQVALRQVNSEASMRLEAINLDKTNIRRRMKALNKDSVQPNSRINSVRQEVEKLYGTPRQHLETIFEQLKKSARVSVDVFGLKDIATRKVFLNRLGSAALRQTVDEQLTMLQSETPGSITLSFDSAEEAHQVRTAAVEHVRDRVRDAFVAADKNAHEVVRAVGAKLTARLQREIGSVAG